MAIHLRKRELPDEHCAHLTTGEWLDGLHRLMPVEPATPAAEVVRQAREAEDAALMDTLSRR